MTQRVFPMIALRGRGRCDRLARPGVRVRGARRALRHGGRDGGTRGAGRRRRHRHARDAEPRVPEPEDASLELRGCGALARQPVGDRRAPRPRRRPGRASCAGARSRRERDQELRRTAPTAASTRPRTSKATAGCSSRHEPSRRVPPEPRAHAVRRGVRPPALARRGGVAGRDPGDGRLPRAPARRHPRTPDGRRRAAHPGGRRRRGRRDRPRGEVDVPRSRAARLLPDPRPPAARQGREALRPRPRGGARSGRSARSSSTARATRA